MLVGMRAWSFVPLALGLSLAACGKSPPPSSPSAPQEKPEPVDDGTPEKSQRPNTVAPIEQTELRAHFQAENVQGTIALFDTSTSELVCSDLERCSHAQRPASTFKIPHTLIGLETGALSSAESPLPWDGAETGVTDWNQDHTLRSAFRTSCVPCYQQVARIVGESSMQNWLLHLGYGNHLHTGGIDQFWLSGDLRITALEQIDFLWRLDAAELPVHESSRAILEDILLEEEGDDFVLRAKTGLSKKESPIGWYVGWVELKKRRVYFATLLEDNPAELDLVPLRRSVTLRVLRAIGVLPSPPPVVEAPPPSATEPAQPSSESSALSH